MIRDYVLGVPVDVGSMSLMTEAIVEISRKKHGGYVCVANVHMVTLAKQDGRLLDVMRNAAYITADGMPLVWVQRSHGYNSAERVSGPDLMEHLCIEATKSKVSVYFYGAVEAVLENLVSRLTGKLPDLLIAGIEAPPILGEIPELNLEVVDRINQSGAGIVFVGLGCPKQELWMVVHTPHISAVMVGVGAAFDFHGGNKRRAPRWMQDSGLEWLFRLAMEPRRLWRRYFVTNSYFLLYLIADRIRQISKRPSN